MAIGEDYAPQSIRSKEFSVRMRGYEVTEVDDYLGDLADLIEDLQEENLRLVRTNRDLRAQIDGEEGAAFGASTPVTAEGQAASILTRAQQMADQLLADADGEARQRVADAANVDLVDYVRTYARVTHDQMKGVVDQLDRQLDRLRELAARDAHGQAWDEARGRTGRPAEEPVTGPDGPDGPAGPETGPTDPSEE